MKTQRLTKKYKNKRNRKSIKSIKSIKSRKIKNKSRKRTLKGGVRPSSRSSGVIISRGSRASVPPIPSSRGTSSTGISKSISKCCQQKVISDGERIIESINNFPHSFHVFYARLLQESDDDLKKKIQNIIQPYITKITIASEGKYPNITGLQLISYLISKRIKSGKVDTDKIKYFFSLLDQCAAAPGVRECDLRVIKKLVPSDYFECYKKLYDDISAKLFRCGNGDCYPVSTSAISLYCHPQFKPKFNPTLQAIREHIP
jgi:hypothetical protein